MVFFLCPFHHFVGGGGGVVSGFLCYVMFGSGASFVWGFLFVCGVLVGLGFCFLHTAVFPAPPNEAWGINSVIFKFNESPQFEGL